MLRKEQRRSTCSSIQLGWRRSCICLDLTPVRTPVRPRQQLGFGASYLLKSGPQLRVYVPLDSLTPCTCFLCLAPLSSPLLPSRRRGRAAARAIPPCALQRRCWCAAASSGHRSILTNCFTKTAYFMGFRQMGNSWISLSFKRTKSCPLKALQCHFCGLQQQGAAL